MIKWTIAGISMMALSCGERPTDDFETPVYGGQIVEEDGSVASYESELTEEIVTATIEVNGKAFTGEFDRSGILSLIGDHDLSLDDKRILKDLSAYILYDGNPDSTVKSYTYKLAEYLSEAPVGHTIPTRSFQSNLNLRNEGIKCIKKGQSIYGQWDTALGEVHGEWVTTNANYGGNYGCMGRCGAGCGWGAPSSYTKDCMDHDICSKRNNSSGGSSDSNCGDEYNQSIDDWMFGTWLGCAG